MKCKNQYCKGTSFCAIIEPDNHSVIGLKCISCQARYLIEEVELKDKLVLKREGAWNSAKWSLKKY